jgi:hypothetical protein
VQCESAGSCSCYLNFTSETYIYNGTGGTVMDIDVSTDCVENGTFTCTAEEAPINVDLRADSITGNIFDVSGYTINPGTVTEDGLTINNQTAMGAMVVYCQENGINVNITTGYWGEYVLQIGNNASDYNYWCYAVNEVVPWVGGAAYDLSGGEFVHWSNCGLNCYTVLTTLNTTSVEVGDYLTATVTWKNVSGIHPLNGASVYETDTLDEWGYPTTGTSVGTTGPDGNCTFQATTPSRWYVYAVDPVHGSGQYNYPPVSFTCTATEFDTNEGTYPSIFGTHYGKIIPDQNLTVNKIYTYPCAGTGGHTEYVIIWNESECAVAEWDGYIGDYHNLSFNRTLRLQKDVVYSYIIRTGSYPQIIHAPYKPVTGGNISCTKFIDANERVYHDWIPAIRLW